MSITLGIYGQVTPTMGRQAGAALSASLLGARGEGFVFLLVAIACHLSPSGDKRMTRTLVIASRRSLPTL